MRPIGLLIVYAISSAAPLQATRSDLVKQLQNYSGRYANNAYAPTIARPLTQSLNALALTTRTKEIQQLLHATGLAALAVDGTANTTTALSSAGSEALRQNPATLYSLRTLAALGALDTLSDIHTQANLIRKAQTRLNNPTPQQIAQRNRMIKNAGLDVAAHLAAWHVAKKATTSPLSQAALRTVISTLLRNILIKNETAAATEHQPSTLSTPQKISVGYRGPSSPTKQSLCV
ncbi:MAG: hypothetical protein QG604_676 [Candidatus Dependentiae bacterium]|nr:hypothetical protein [Candidatus Dependentiae bacterium]